MNSFLARGVRLLTTLILICCATRALAHDPGLSSANLQLRAGKISVVVTYNDRDISTVLGEDAQAVRRGGPAFQKELTALTQRVLLLEVDGRQVQAKIESANVDQNKNVEFTYTYDCPPGARAITVRSQLLSEMPFGHRQAFAAVNAAGNEVARSLLSSRETTATVILAEATASSSHSLADFFLLGVRHILTGYDHLLFLFGLLIVCRNLREATLLITCFTIAHSLTLALSTFGLVQLPSRLVETAIAASILYVGLENLARRVGRFRGRWLLTFGFGLVHGLGFAGALREMGVANSGWATTIPLAGFNSGVEVGQLCFAGVLLPLILHYRKQPRFLRAAVPACSIAVAAAGGCWLVQRAFFG